LDIPTNTRTTQNGSTQREHTQLHNGQSHGQQGTKGIQLIYTTIIFLFVYSYYRVAVVKEGTKAKLTGAHLIVEVTASQPQYHDYVCNTLLQNIQQYGWNKSQVRQAADNLIKEHGNPTPKYYR
jgi:hypothetical protein